MKTVYRHPLLNEQRRIVAYLDSDQAWLASLRELQSQTGEELRWMSQFGGNFPANWM